MRGSVVLRALTAAGRLVAAVWAGSLPARLARSGRAARAAETSAAAAALRALARPLARLRPVVAGSALVARVPVSRAVPGLALALPFLPTTVDVVLIWAAALVLALQRWRDGRPVVGRGGPYALVALLAVFLAIAALASVTPVSSIVALVLWFSWFLLFWLAAEAAGPGEVRAGQWMLALGAGLVALVGIAQAHAGIQTRESWIDEKANPGLTTRVFSVFDDPNMLAAYFTCVVPAAAALCLSEARYWLKGAALVLLGLGVACDVLTFSRGGWLALVVAFAVLGGLWRPRWLVVVWGGLAALLAAAVLAGPSALRVRLDSLLGGEDSSIQYRISIWTGVSHMARDYLWTGVGLGQGAFGAVYPHYMLAGTEAAHAHDIYLEVLAEVGLPGFLAFLALAGAICLRLLRGALAGSAAAVRSLARSREACRMFAAAALAGVVAVLVEGLADNVWYNPRAAMALWLVAGLGLAAARAARGEAAPDGPAEGGAAPGRRRAGGGAVPHAHRARHE